MEGRHHFHHKLVFKIPFFRHWSSEMFLEIHVRIVVLKLLHCHQDEHYLKKGNVTSELWPKFFQDRFFTTHLPCEKLFATALKCLGPPFSDTICHAEPLSSILFRVQSLIQSSVFRVSRPCVMSLKRQRPQEELEESDFLLLFSHSDDSAAKCFYSGRSFSESTEENKIRQSTRSMSSLWSPREELSKGHNV